MLNKLFILFLFLFTGPLCADLIDESGGPAPKKVPKPPAEVPQEVKDVGSPEKDQLQDPRAAQTEEKKSKKDQSKKSTLTKDSHNKKEPVYITGEELTVSKETGAGEIHRNVVVTQGDLRLEADFAEVLYDQTTKEVNRVIAKGHVKMKKKGVLPDQNAEAKCGIAEFDVKGQRVVMKEDAELLRDGDILKGSVINYNLKTGWATVSKVKGLVKP